MSIITFKDGIPGLEEYTEYQIEISEDKDNPFHKLQSLEEPLISFIIIDPFKIKPDYDFKLSESTVEKLEVDSPEDIVVYSILTIPTDDYKNMTTNLLAPIIINTKNNKAKQVVLSDTDYEVKYKFIESGE